MKTKTLKREVFQTSRLMEYFTVKELRAQIGHDKEYWPLAILRELIDNSLDACESKGIAPIINVTIADDILSVQDNGPGIPVRTVKKSLDYMLRVSDKSYYISPTRGQMGNALKTVYAAAYVATGEGSVEIIAGGKRHLINVSFDRIKGEPVLDYRSESDVSKGTLVKLSYKNLSCLLMDESVNSYKSAPTAYEIINSFAAFNPHATFTLNDHSWLPTCVSWNKWLPSMPTSAHWYNVERMTDLIAAYISNGGAKKTVREFVSEFKGLSSTIKQKNVTGGYSRSYLSEFVRNKDINRDAVSELLSKMQTECTPPKPKVLGLIGEDHIKAWMIANGGIEDSLEYVKKLCYNGELPEAIEIGFAVDESEQGRKLAVGLNWSPVIGGSPSRTISDTLQEAKVSPYDNVILFIHVATPVLNFLDRGKTRIR